MERPATAFQPGLLRNRDFLSLWGAQVLSQTAANAVTYALVILVFRQTHQNTASSFLILLAILPAILFGTLAGVMVDRVDRKLVRKHDLLAANSLFSFTFYGSFVLGFALLAPIVIGFGDLDFLFSLMTS